MAYNPLMATPGELKDYWTPERLAATAAYTEQLERTLKEKTWAAQEALKYRQHALATDGPELRVAGGDIYAKRVAEWVSDIMTLEKYLKGFNSTREAIQVNKRVPVCLEEGYIWTHSGWAKPQQ